MSTNPNDDQQWADHQLIILLVLGVVLAFLGGFVAAAAWPHPDELVDQGSQGVTLVGVALFWAGNMLSAVGLIGWGVKFGNQATRRASSPV